MLFAVLASPIFVPLFTTFIALVAPPEVVTPEALLEFFQDPSLANYYATTTKATSIAPIKIGLKSCPTFIPMTDERELFQTKESHPRPNTPIAITLFDYDAPPPITNYGLTPSILNLATIAKTQTPSGITSPTATTTSRGLRRSEELPTKLWTGPSENDLLLMKPMVVVINAPTGLRQELELKLARTRAEEDFWSIKTIYKLLQLFLLRIKTWFSESQAKRSTILTTLMMLAKVYGPPMKYKVEATRWRRKIMRLDQPRK